MSDSSEAFETHVGPPRVALTALLDSGEELRQRWGSLPDANSRAMAEIASEGQYVGASPWGDEPVQQAHHLGHLLLLSSDDSVRAACKLLSEGEAPVFAHVVLARSALEHAGRAWWLLDPDLTIRQRVIRGFNERLYSLVQQTRLAIERDARRKARDRIRGIFEEGERIGFRRLPAERGQPASLEERRPSPTRLMGRLLEIGGDEDLGKLVYSYFSAVTHGTAFGLTQSVDRDMATAPPELGLQQGALFTSSQAVCTVLTGLILGSGRALKARNDLFAWESAKWNTTMVSAFRAARASLGFAD